jgi:glucokinase
MAVIGFDLGGTKLASAVFSDYGKIIIKENIFLEKRKGSEVGELLKELTNKYLKNFNDIESIGISVPGISYSKTGKVWAPNIPGWEDYPLLNDIEQVTEEKVKVTIDSDRACYILGEVWQGNAKGCKDAIFLAVGTGIGAGILVNGEILRGSNDIAGAIGWLALDKPFLEKYISCGCFEYYASGEGLAKVGKEYLHKDINYEGILNVKKENHITAHDIFEAYDQKDPIAEKVIKQAIEFWGMATANLVSLFNPEKIIFGGGVFGPAVKFLNDIMAEAKKWSQPISIKQVKLVGSKLGGDAGLFGAGYLALKSVKETQKEINV